MRGVALLVLLATGFACGKAAAQGSIADELRRKADEFLRDAIRSVPSPQSPIWIPPQLPAGTPPSASQPTAATRVAGSTAMPTSSVGSIRNHPRDFFDHQLGVDHAMRVNALPQDPTVIANSGEEKVLTPVPQAHADHERSDGAVGDTDWVGVAAQVSPEITEHFIKEGVTSVTAGLVSDAIIALGARIPEEIARKLLLSPRKLIGWSARITSREVTKDFLSADSIGLALGVVVEMLVGGVRDTCPCPGTSLANQYLIESWVWSLRQSAVGYAFTRAGLHGAIAAEAIITGVTVTEALTEAIKLQGDRREEEESKIMTEIMQRVRDFSNEIKTETEPQRKAERLQALDDYLRRELTRLPGKAAQLDAWRQKLLASLAQINGLHDARSARVQGARFLYAMRKGDKWGFVDRDGRPMVPFQFERISSLEDTWAENFSSQYQESDFFVGALLAVRYRGKWGFIDQDGAWVVPPRFEAVGDCLVAGDPGKVDCFSYGPAPVKQNGRWGYVDRSGGFIIPPQFDEALGFADRGIATVKLGAQYGVIDAGGRYVLEPRFSGINVFEAGVIDAQDESGHFALFDQTGKRIADQPGWRIGGVPSEGLRSLTLHDGRVGVIELTSGRTVVPFRFQEVGRFGEGLAYAVSDTQRGYIDRLGKFVFIGPFEQGGRFREGLAEIRLRGKFGFVDRTGKIVVEPRFDSVGEFRDGIAWVRMDTKQGYISKNGAFAIQPRFDWIGSFHADRARAHFEGKWVLVDRTGNIVYTLH